VHLLLRTRTDVALGRQNCSGERDSVLVVTGNADGLRVWDLFQLRDTSSHG
jgi:hypothetical protein